METLDVSLETEMQLQADHDDDFVYRAAQRVYVEKCGTCAGFPLWGCKVFGHTEGESCFIKCPACGRYGFTPPHDNFVPDHDLAALLREKMGR